MGVVQALTGIQLKRPAQVREYVWFLYVIIFDWHFVFNYKRFIDLWFLNGKYVKTININNVKHNAGFERMNTLTVSGQTSGKVTK